MLEMRRCDVIDITFSGSGGGIRNQNGAVTLRNCRIEGNTAQQGTGIFTGSSPSTTPSSVTLFNTEVRNNTATSIVNRIGAGIYNFDGTSTVTISNDSFICENDPEATQCERLDDTSRCFATCPD